MPDPAFSVPENATNALLMRYLMQLGLMGAGVGAGARGLQGLHGLLSRETTPAAPALTTPARVRVPMPVFKEMPPKRRKLAASGGVSELHPRAQRLIDKGHATIEDFTDPRTGALYPMAVQSQYAAKINLGADPKSLNPYGKAVAQGPAAAKQYIEQSRAAGQAADAQLKADEAAKLQRRRELTTTPGMFGHNSSRQLGQMPGQVAQQQVAGANQVAQAKLDLQRNAGPSNAGSTSRGPATQQWEQSVVAAPRSPEEAFARDMARPVPPTPRPAAPAIAASPTPAAPGPMPAPQLPPARPLHSLFAGMPQTMRPQMPSTRTTAAQLGPAPALKARNPAASLNVPMPGPIGGTQLGRAPKMPGLGASALSKPKGIPGLPKLANAAPAAQPGILQTIANKATDVLGGIGRPGKPVNSYLWGKGTSILDKPGLSTAAPFIGVGGVYGGYRLADYLLNKSHEAEQDSELEAAKANYERMLLDAIAKQGSADPLDELADAYVEKCANILHQGGSLAAMLASMTALGAGTLGYNWTKARHNNRALRDAIQERRRQLAAMAVQPIYATPEPYVVKVPAGQMPKAANSSAVAQSFLQSLQQRRQASLDAAMASLSGEKPEAAQPAQPAQQPKPLVLEAGLTHGTAAAA